MPTKKELETTIRRLTRDMNDLTANLRERWEDIRRLEAAGKGSTERIKGLRDKSVLQACHIRALRTAALTSTDKAAAADKLIGYLQMYIVKNGLMAAHELGRDDFPELEPPF